ncbi:MAG: efflux transporter periplasmic adaptor subunit, partial [Desulfatitalea sp.]|nr:efflux transporter periplasmic adaptor subunit [Desulfatitalea sp.]
PRPPALPPIGELAEVTVTLQALPSAPVVPNAAIKRLDGRLGVWVAAEGDLRFAPIRVGAQDLDGRVQVTEGLDVGERVVVYTRQALTARSRIKIVERVPGVTP